MAFACVGFDFAKEHVAVLAIDDNVEDLEKYAIEKHPDMNCIVLDLSNVFKSMESNLTDFLLENGVVGSDLKELKLMIAEKLIKEVCKIKNKIKEMQNGSNPE